MTGFYVILCVQNILAGTGSSIALPENFMLQCDQPLNNVLVNQVVTTILNIRYNLLFNPNGPLDFGNYQLAATCINIPQDILDELPDDPTINDFIDYTNDFLGCVCEGTCGNYMENMAKLTCVFQGLNSRWENCNIVGPCPFGGIDVFGDLADLLNEGGSSPISISNMSNLQPDFSIYPNPTSAEINLQIGISLEVPGRIEIYNNIGMKMAERELEAFVFGAQRFNVSNFSEGIYFISVTGNDGTEWTEKFVITR